MEGPTPVSALIHAATMVTAGVYLIARAHPIYDHAPIAATTVAVIGCATAFFAATIGTVQYDIKRVLAYSTMSQIGYMVLAVGVGAYAAGTFHFITHAFFKALLFMAAGIIIHNLGGEQDIRKMGGLARRMPLAFLDVPRRHACHLWHLSVRRFLFERCHLRSTPRVRTTPCSGSSLLRRRC